MDVEDESSSGSFEGYVPVAPKASVTQQTWIGKIRRFSSFSMLEKIFGIISVTCLAVVFAITIYKLVTVPVSSADFTFGVVLLLNVVFCTYYILNGMFFERPYEIGIFVLAVLCTWIYLILNYFISIKGDVKLSRLVIVSALSPCVIIMGVLIARRYKCSKSLIFRTVGAQSDLQKSCSTMFMFFCLLKADLQISLSLAVLILTSPENMTLIEIILLPLSVVLGVTHFWTGYFSARLENKCVFAIWWILWFFMPGYASYLIYVAVNDLVHDKDYTDMVRALYAVVFVVAGCCWLIRCISLYLSIKVCRNFGKGLKQKVFGAPQPQSFTHDEDNPDG